jgi:hypothetical protein
MLLTQTQNQAVALYNQAEAFLARNKTAILMVVALLALLVASQIALAGTAADAWAEDGYDFIKAMATGNFMRGICLVGGIVGVIAGAGTGKPILALTGVVLAAFAFLSPTLIEAIFGTALI